MRDNPIKPDTAYRKMLRNAKVNGYMQSETKPNQILTNANVRENVDICRHAHISRGYAMIEDTRPPP